MRFKVRRSSIDSPWGATLPVELVPETTDDDDFEERAVDWLQLFLFPAGAFRTLCGRAWPIQQRGAKKYLRPDIVTLIANTSTVVFVGDAKRHRRLETRSVEKVVRYRRATKAEKAAIFVPQTCKVGKAVQARADRERVLIVRL
jgi:hypothetical protein